MPTPCRPARTAVLVESRAATAGVSTSVSKNANLGGAWLMSERAERQAVVDWANDFDHFDPAFVSAPERIWSELREGCPVAHSDRYGGLNVVTRWEDVQEVARDTATFSSRRVLVNEVP